MRQRTKRGARRTVIFVVIVFILILWLFLAQLGIYTVFMSWTKVTLEGKMHNGKISPPETPHGKCKPIFSGMPVRKTIDQGSVRITSTVQGKTKERLRDLVFQPRSILPGMLNNGTNMRNTEMKNQHGTTSQFFRLLVSLVPECDGLNSAPTSKFLCWSPPLTVVLFGREAFGRSLRLDEAEKRGPRDGTGALVRRDDTRISPSRSRSLLSLSTI